MTLPLDDRATRRLAVVRQLYLTAERAARDQGNPVAGMMAVVGFDLAVETLLKAFIADADTGPRKERTIHDLLKKCDTLLESAGLPAIPLRAQMLQVHTSRNTVQHDAQFPHSQVVDDARVYVHGFCQQFALNVWGADFDRISLVDMIRDELTRRVLQRASEDITAGNMKRGLGLVSHAFKCACDFPFLRSRGTHSYIGFPQETGLSSNAHRAIGAGVRAARDDAVNLSAMMAGVSSLGDLSRFMQIIPMTEFGTHFEVHSDFITHLIAFHWRDGEPELSEAQWALHFAVDSVVSWQQQGLPAIIANREDHTIWAEIMLDWDEENPQVQRKIER